MRTTENQIGRIAFVTQVSTAAWRPGTGWWTGTAGWGRDRTPQEQEKQRGEEKHTTERSPEKRPERDQRLEMENICCCLQLRDIGFLWQRRSINISRHLAGCLFLLVNILIIPQGLLLCVAGGNSAHALWVVEQWVIEKMMRTMHVVTINKTEEKETTDSSEFWLHLA